MPIGLQIWTIKRIVERANQHLSDPVEMLEGLAFEDSLDNLATLPENIRNLEDNPDFFDFCFRVSKRRLIAPNKPKRFQKVRRYVGPKSDSFSLVADIIVKPHKVRAKGKTYLHGRIQLTIDKELIGHKAKVSVVIPHVYSSNGTVIPLENDTQH